MDIQYTEDEMAQLLDEAFARGYEAGLTDRKSGLTEALYESDDAEDTLG